MAHGCIVEILTRNQYLSKILVKKYITQKKQKFPQNSLKVDKFMKKFLVFIQPPSPLQEKLAYIVCSIHPWLAAA